MSTLISKDLPYKEDVYKLSSKSLNLLDEMKIELNQQYIDNLLTYANPFWQNKNAFINFLIKDDYWNRIAYSQKGLGGIIQCNKEGKRIQSFNNLQSVIFSETPGKYIYTFQIFIEQKKDISRSRVDFFGVNFLPLYDQMSNGNFAINFLNYTIKDILNWKTGKRAKSSYKEYRKRNKELSFQLFVDQCLNFKTYDFGRLITYWLARVNRSKEDRSKLDKTAYQESLTNVIDRYYIKDTTLIQNVENLNQYDCSGIYILCHDDFCGYYVGKTSISIKKRIIRHYQQLNSDFDKLYGYNDVKSIYVLKCPSDMLNRVEQDIIATISPQFLLNCLAGGDSINAIVGANYSHEKYAFTSGELKIIKSYLHNSI